MHARKQKFRKVGPVNTMGMGFFGSGKNKQGTKSSSLKIRKSLELNRCGDPATDVAIEQFNHLQESTSRVHEAVAVYLESIRKSGVNSSNLVQTLNGFYAGSNEMIPVMRQYQEIHLHADVNVPEHLITAAKEHIQDPLESYLGDIRVIRQQVVDFYDATMKFQHYESKVEGLEKAKRKRAKKGKVESGKKKDELARNLAKLDDSRASLARKREYIIGKLAEMQENKTVVMDPVFRKINVLQQEYFKQSLETLRNFKPDALEALPRNASKPAIVQKTIQSYSPKEEMKAIEGYSPKEEPLKIEITKESSLTIHDSPASEPDLLAFQKPEVAHTEDDELLMLQ